MELQTIRATVRTTTKKGPSRRTRAQGLIPAAIHSGSGLPTLITLNPDDLVGMKRGSLGWNQPVSIEVQGGQPVKMAMLKEVQRHPVSGAYLHADFVEIKEGALVVVHVPVTTTGKAIGEENGGRVAVPVRALRVRCAPDAIPKNLPIDVTAMGVGDKLLVSALTLPEGVLLVDKTETPLVTVVGKRGAEEKPAAAAEEKKA